jgi:hypothetical protein
VKAAAKLNIRAAQGTHNRSAAKNMDRELTKQERDWLIRGLNSLKTGEYLGGNQLD